MPACLLSKAGERLDDAVVADDVAELSVLRAPVHVAVLSRLVDVCATHTLSR